MTHFHCYYQAGPSRVILLLLFIFFSKYVYSKILKITLKNKQPIYKILSQCKKLLRQLLINVDSIKIGFSKHLKNVQKFQNKCTRYLKKICYKVIVFCNYQHICPCVATGDQKNMYLKPVRIICACKALCAHEK